jgi:hypothetical protein
MRQASLKRVSKRKKEEAISYISSYQTLTADKNSKSYWVPAIIGIKFIFAIYAGINRE